MQRVQEPQPSRTGAGADIDQASIGDEGSDGDERADAGCDGHGVLAVEREAGAACSLTVDVVVRVDEDGRSGAL